MKSGRRQKQLSRLLVNGTLLLFVVLWTIPTMGIFISSFRNRDDIATSGWWNVFPHREWQPVGEIDPKALGVDPNQVMEIEGVKGTFEEFRAGIETPDGKRVTWIGNKRLGRVELPVENIVAVQRRRGPPHRPRRGSARGRPAPAAGSFG